MLCLQPEVQPCARGSRQLPRFLFPPPAVLLRPAQPFNRVPLMSPPFCRMSFNHCAGWAMLSTSSRCLALPGCSVVRNCLDFPALCATLRLHGSHPLSAPRWGGAQAMDLCWLCYGILSQRLPGCSMLIWREMPLFESGFLFCTMLSGSLSYVSVTGTPWSGWTG